MLTHEHAFSIHPNAILLYPDMDCSLQARFLLPYLKTAENSPEAPETPFASGHQKAFWQPLCEGASETADRY